MALETRSSSRLRARKESIDVKSQHNNNQQQQQTEYQANETKSVDLEALVSQAYTFIASKLAARKCSLGNTDERKKHPLDLERSADVISLTSEFTNKANDLTELASELQPGLKPTELYLKFDRPSTGTTITASDSWTSERNINKLMKKSVITSDFEKQHTAPPMHVSLNTLRYQKKLIREQSTGPKWFNLPATELTPELKQELKLLKMRNVLDRKRHYKKNDTKELPKYFQMGRVVEGAADFYSSRIPKRDRKNTIINELLADADFRRYNKKKFLEIQATKQSGRKGFYKKKMSRRKPAWARN